MVLPRGGFFRRGTRTDRFGR